MQRNEAGTIDLLENALADAIKDNNAYVAKHLCKSILHEIKTRFVGEKLLRQDENNNSFLHLALSHGADDAFEMLFSYYRGEPDIALLCDNEGRSLFWLALSRSKREIAEKLLFDYKKRAEREAKQAIEQESEQESEQETKQSVRNALLKLLKANNEGVTPIHLAAKNADPEWLPWLMTNLALQDSAAELLNSLDEQGNSPLQYACLNGRRSQIVYLLVHGAEVDASIVNYLEQDLSLFSTEDLTKSTKRRILNYIYLQMIDNDERANDEDKKDETNNEEKIKLISFYKELASQTSLIDAIKANIQGEEAEDVLDDVQREMLGMDYLQERQKRQLFYRDKADLQTYLNSIENFAPAPLTRGGVIINIMGMVASLLAGIAGLSGISALGAVGVLATFGASSPTNLIFVFVGGLSLVGSTLMLYTLAVSMVTLYDLQVVRRFEMQGLPLLKQANDILAKLERLEEVNSDALRVDPHTIAALKECVDYKPVSVWEMIHWMVLDDESGIEDLNRRIKALKPLIEEISQAMIEQKQPISTIENIQQAPSVSATEEIFSELGIEATANSAVTSPLTFSSNKDESSSAPSSPRVMSLFAQPPQSRFALEEEENIPLLIAEERKPSLSMVIQQD